MTSGERVVAAAVVLVGACFACSKPAPLDVRITVQPVDDRVYAIDDRLGFENVHFGLELNPPDAVFDTVHVAFLDGRTVVEDIRWFDVALATRRKQGVLKPFHLMLPKSAKADRMTVTVRRGERSASRAVPLVRYEQKNSYRLPVNGCWFVSSGHDFGVEHRRHYSRGHFAWDFVRVDAMGKPHAGGGLAVTDYYAYGQDVVAPADGTVVFARGDQPDNRPGETSQDANYVLIDHGGGEFSKLAHFAPNTLAVKPGATVKRGDVIAKIGNSGRSDSPHLHVHFQETFFDKKRVVTAERPLPIRFDDYLVTSNEGLGRPVERGDPRRGEFVCTR